ncbi:transposase [Chryseobacterium kwangjuense]|uniref:Transposase n=1 Tax=Chryseobacterium kwangjuense TaxID=267125 RepID=A0A135WF28_9FLAO|nr:transposase [Chryseobacterium kwangjuense]KXH83514.1 transposase [Chryseobacterium kwangjuense]
MDIKNIMIGNLIEIKCKESGISKERIRNFLKCDEAEIQSMYESNTIDTGYLLRWSKLLKYDFFRIYTQHLILYAPVSDKDKKSKVSVLPQYRKNMYTRDIIDFILELLETNQKTKRQVIEEYRIPKTTLYKWLAKYQKK